MARHFIDFELLDFSESKAGFTVYTGAITPVSLPGFLTQLGNLRGALDAITLGTIRRERWVGDETLLSSVPPSNSGAVNKLKWLVDYEDVVHGFQFSLTIPTPDLSKLVNYNQDWIDFSDTDVQAFVTAFEAIAVSPLDDTIGVVVDHIQLIGRRT
jgi:hypothetical protein